MKILITGATGFLGKPLTLRLLQAGHHVVALARHPRRLPDHPHLVRHYWDATRGAPDPAVLRDVEAVIHLAGASIGRLPWTPGYRNTLWHSRVEGTRWLARSLKKARAPLHTVVAASATGYYGDRGDQPLTEEASPGKGFLARLVQAWENAILELCAPVPRCLRFRFGMVLGRKGGAFPRMYRGFWIGGGVMPGAPESWWAWIHEEDARELLWLGVHGDLPSGVYNAVAPEPVRQRTFVQALARRIHRPVWGTLPSSLLRFLLGDAAALFLWSQRVIPRRLQEQHHTWQVSTLDEALQRLLE